MSEKPNLGEIVKVENIHQQIIDNLPTPIGYINREGEYLYKNQSCQALGFGNFFDLFGDNQKSVIENQFKDIDTKSEPIKFEYSNNNHFYKCQISKSTSQSIPGFLFQAIDITKEKQELFDANHDNLTGVYNRNFGETELKRLCSTDRPRNALSVALIDMDGLKIINDFGSYEQGDKYIKDIGQGLKSEFRTTDIVCRWGGDEFVIILPDCQGNEEETIKRIKEVGLQNKIRLSVGFANRKVEESKDQKKLLKEAEEKCKKDKGNSSRELIAKAYGH